MIPRPKIIVDKENDAIFVDNVCSYRLTLILCSLCFVTGAFFF